MSDERTAGVILRVRPLTETSLIANWLTPDLGRISTVARGALRPKSPFRGKLDLFFFADFTFNRSRRSDLHALREIAVRNHNAALREDITRLREAAYVSQLIEQNTETETPLPALFDLFQSTLQEIATNPPRVLRLIAFESRFLADMGLAPSLADASLTLGSKKILEQIMFADWERFGRLQSSRAQNLELSRFLLAQLVSHFGNAPKARPGLIEALGN
ncbi:MAG: DNA repair protein RecO [Verrucomicrobia bacterium]|nr:DNA repair protein RecO [Verrucomicrobiota bacterium]